MKIPMFDLKVGEYFKDSKTGIVWLVMCNDWWNNETLRDFIVVDANGNKKHHSHFKKTMNIFAYRVNGFEETSEIEQLKAENQKLRETLKETQSEILSIGDILSAATAHGEQIDLVALNEKMHEIYLLLDGE